MSNISDIEKWPTTAANLLKAFKNQVPLHKLFCFLGEGDIQLTTTQISRLRVIGIPVFDFCHFHTLSRLRVIGIPFRNFLSHLDYA